MRLHLTALLALATLTGGCEKKDDHGQAKQAASGELPQAQYRAVRFRQRGQPASQPASQPATGLPAGHPPTGAAPAPTGAPPSPAAPAGGSIAGTVSLPAGKAEAAKAGAVLFIMARVDAGEGKPGPPIAAKRVPVTGPDMFPYAFSIGSSDVMMAGTPFQGSLRVSIRLDGDGAALTKKPGDLSTASVAATVGATDLALTLDQAL